MTYRSAAYRLVGMGLFSAVTLAAATSHTHAVFALDADFDHGSLESYSLSSGSTVNLVGRDNYYPGEWKWVYFKASGVNGFTPTFRIDDNFSVGSVANDNWRYSYDNENWTPFDNHGVSGGLFQVSNNSAFTQDEVWVAYSLPYSYGRAADKVNEWKLHPHVGPTISSNADLVIGQSPGGIDDLGRTVTPKDMWGFKVTDPSVPAAGKTKIVMVSGMHAQETLGNHALDGTIDWLLGNDSRAAELRKTAEFYVYPMLNPDGRYAGYNRGTVQNPNQDPNRFWSPTGSNNWQSKPDIKLAGEAMMADLEVASGGEADYFIDYHSTVSSSSDPDDFMFLHPEKGHTDDPFWTHLLDETDTMYWVQSTSTGNTSANFGEIELGADFDATYETAFHPSRGTDYYHEQGKDIGVAFFMTLARKFYDINADGFVGLEDLDVLLANWNQSVPIGDHSQGDLAGTGDGFVGLSDLDVILNNWNTGTPPAPAAIPEPTSSLCLLTGLAALLRRRQA